MKTATTTEFRVQLTSYLNQREPVVVKQKGRYKAVLIPVEREEDVERLMMLGNKRLMEVVFESDRQIDETCGIPHDEFWKRIDAKYAKKSNGQHERKAKW